MENFEKREAAASEDTSPALSPRHTSMNAGDAPCHANSSTESEDSETDISSLPSSLSSARTRARTRRRRNPQHREEFDAASKFGASAGTHGAHGTHRHPKLAFKGTPSGTARVLSRAFT